MERLKKNIEAIYRQVDDIVFIDNCSEDHTAIIKFCNQFRKIRYYCNNENLGVSYALNQIMEWGFVHEYQWGITLDQDSICSENIVFEYSKYTQMENVGLLAPVIKDINQISSQINVRDGITYITDCESVITSGSCVNIQIYRDIGGFNEKLFIDFIDVEYNKRLLIQNYKIVRINSVLLLHEVGHIKEYGKIFKITCSNHNALRRYYMVRNRLYFKAKYCRKIDFFYSCCRLFLGTFKISIFESDKINKAKSTIRGFRDYKMLL